MSTCPQCGYAGGHAADCPYAVGFTELIVQSEQLRQLAAIQLQLQQITGIQAEQLRLQRQQVLEQQRQAALQQILFEQERFVQGLEHLSAIDRFAAALYGSLRVNAIKAARIGPEHFVAIEHKRAFQAAIDHMHSLGSAFGAGDQQIITATICAFDEYLRFERELELRSHEDVRGLEAQANAQEKGAQRAAAAATKMMIAGVCCGLVTVTMIAAAVAFVSPLQLHLLAPAVVPAIGIIALPWGIDRRQTKVRCETEARRLRASAAELRSLLTSFDAWMGKSGGGLLLGVVADEHPVLRALPGLEKLPVQAQRRPAQLTAGAGAADPASLALQAADAQSPLPVAKRVAIGAGAFVFALSVVGFVAMLAMAIADWPNRCRDTLACSTFGTCTPEGEYDCVAATDEDCARSTECAGRGNCQVETTTGRCRP